MTTPSREEAPERVLLPCPFCGGRFGSPIEGQFLELLSAFYIECPCGAEMNGQSVELVRTNWNTRANLTNREPGEGDVERGAIAMMKTGENQAVGRRLTSEFTDAEILAMTASAFKAWSER